MPIGPHKKTEIELHWQHQKDHVFADIRAITRRLQNDLENAAFSLVIEAYKRDGTLLDVRAEQDAIVSLVRKAVAALPAGD